MVNFLKDYADAGMTTCCLCDTIGIADPAQVKSVIGELKASYPNLQLQVHFHDTRGLGMVNTMAAIESGVTEVQSAPVSYTHLDVYKRQGGERGWMRLQSSPAGRRRRPAAAWTAWDSSTRCV